MEMELIQENYENIDNAMCESQLLHGTTAEKNKPKLPTEALSPTEDGTSGIDDDNYEDADVEQNEYENTKPEIPPKSNTDSTDALQTPRAKYTDYKQQSDYLLPKRSTGDNKNKVYQRIIVGLVVALIISIISIVLVALVVRFTVCTKDAELHNYILPIMDPDKIYKIYTTTQKKQANITISIETKHKISAIKYDIKYCVKQGNTKVWSNFLVQGKANATEILSDNKVISMYQQDLSDSFLLLPEKCLTTQYTIASIPHRTDEQNNCDNSFFLYAKEKRVTYTDGSHGTSPKPVDRAGNVEKQNVSIEASSPIGVLNMYECKGPKYSHLCDKSYEQVIPDKYLGKEYFVPSFDMKQQNYSIYITITSPVDSNDIEYMYDNQKETDTFSLKKGEASKRTHTPASITCSKTCSVSVMIQFHKSVNHSNIALTNIIATKNFLRDKTFFSADMSRTSWPYLYLLVVIASGKVDKAHSKLRLDGGQMQSQWKTQMGFTFGVLTDLERKTHYLESEGLPYMGYLVGSDSASCGFAHFIGLNLHCE